MHTESIFAYVKRRLSEERGNFRVIAVATGVPYSTLVKIHQGVIENPGVMHIQTLADHFRAAAQAEPAIT